METKAKKPPQSQTPRAPSAREERVAAALRENLLKRKQQERARRMPDQKETTCP
jgi:hypothetical protein